MYNTSIADLLRASRPSQSQNFTPVSLGQINHKPATSQPQSSTLRSQQTRPRARPRRPRPPWARRWRRSPCRGSRGARRCASASMSSTTICEVRARVRVTRAQAQQWFTSPTALGRAPRLNWASACSAHPLYSRRTVGQNVEARLHLRRAVAGTAERDGARLARDGAGEHELAVYRQRLVTEGAVPASL